MTPVAAVALVFASISVIGAAVPVSVVADSTIMRDGPQLHVGTFSDADLEADRLEKSMESELYDSCDTDDGDIVIATMELGDDTSSCHYPRGSCAVVHVFINHAGQGGTWTPAQMDAVGIRARDAKGFYLDYAPRGANLSFDHQRTRNYFFLNPTLNYPVAGRLSDQNIRDALTELGIEDWNGNGEPFDDFSFGIQSGAFGPPGPPHSGWDNVIVCYLRTGFDNASANSNVSWSFVRLYEGNSWRTYAHEWGHLFGHCDEYHPDQCASGGTPGTPCSSCEECTNEYYGIYSPNYPDLENGNCAKLLFGWPVCPSNVPCVMRSNRCERWWEACNGGPCPPCEYTQDYWSWIDSDNDGILDTARRRVPSFWLPFVPIVELPQESGISSNMTTASNSQGAPPDRGGWVFSQREPRWAVVGIRNPAPAYGEAFYWLFLYGDNNHNWQKVSGVYPPFARAQFVVEDFNHSRVGNEHVGIWFVDGDRSSDYRIQWASGVVMLPVGVPWIIGWAGNDVVRVWDVPLRGGLPYEFVLNAFADLDLGIALFRSDERQTGTWWQPRIGAEWEERVVGPASTSHIYTAPEDDVYGLVVWANERRTGEFTITVYPPVVPVHVTRFETAEVAGGVLVSWETSSEEHDAGFHVSRAGRGGDRFTRITEEMIKCTGDRGSQYEFFDGTAVPNVTYVYQLEAIARSGEVTILRQQKLAATRGVPNELALHQSCPNPFNPSTTIPFDLPAAARVTLRIRDINGRTVRTLANAQYAPGYYAVEWDGSDDYGRSVGAGVYACQLQVGQRTLTGKLVLTR